MMSETEVSKLRQKIKKGMVHAKQRLLFWDKRIKELSGGLKTCDLILTKKAEEKK